MESGNKRRVAFAVGIMVVAGVVYAQRAPTADRVEVTFNGGFQTDRRDHGRPVALIAAALGVPTEVFRDAFSRVTPSRNGPPDPELARRNKSALLGTLARYGVTNERLDKVSNYYRYRPERGETWPTRPARAFAVLVKGKIARYVVIDPGSGYCTPPTITVPGFADAFAKVALAFDKRFAQNGSIASIAVPNER